MLIGRVILLEFGMGGMDDFKGSSVARLVGWLMDGVCLSISVVGVIGVVGRVGRVGRV